ncbi:MAG: histidine phosphatase family protein [Chthoniobacterales bacterium]
MRLLLLAILCMGCAAVRGHAQPVVFLVRHAEKAAQATGDSDNPSLSDLGHVRAESLRKTLKDAGITAVFATEFKRTQQTADAVAITAAIPLIIVPANDTAALISKLKQARGNALVVGHSNTLPEIIKALGVTVPVTVDENAYDDLFLVVMSSPPQLVRLHYR